MHIEKLIGKSTRRLDAQTAKEFRAHADMRVVVVNKWGDLQRFILQLKKSLPTAELQKTHKDYQDEKGTKITETHIDPAIHIQVIHPLKLVEKEFDVPMELENLNGSAKEKGSIRLGLYIEDELGGDEDESLPFLKFTRLTNDEGIVTYRVGGKPYEFDSRQVEKPEEFQQKMELAFGAIKELGVDPYLLVDLLPISGDDLL